MDSKTFRYIQSADMTHMQYVDDFYAKACKVADFYAESILNIFIEGVDPYICHSPLEYWATHLQADVVYITFKALSLFAIQERATKPAITNNQDASSKKYGKRTWNKPSAHATGI